MAKIVAVAYARYSSDRQQESSITVQLNAIRKFCQENNIKLIHEYVDEAQSGTNARRKHFQQMIEDAKERKFRLVIVHRMDRWARNVDDARHYKKLLLSYGVKMASAIEGFNESPEGEFFSRGRFPTSCLVINTPILHQVPPNFKRSRRRESVSFICTMCFVPTVAFR